MDELDLAEDNPDPEDWMDEFLRVRLPGARRAVGKLTLSDAEHEVLSRFDTHLAVVTAARDHQSPTKVDPGVAVKALLKAYRAAEELDAMRPSVEDDEPQIGWLASCFDGFWTDVSHEIGFSAQHILVADCFLGESPAVLLIERFLVSWFSKN